LGEDESNPTHGEEGPGLAAGANRTGEERAAIQQLQQHDHDDRPVEPISQEILRASWAISSSRRQETIHPIPTAQARLANFASANHGAAAGARLPKMARMTATTPSQMTTAPSGV
jgi:hypothetical protein